MNNIKNSIDRLINLGAFHISLGAFASKFVAFFGSMVVVRLLPKSDYGVMSYAENIYNYALIFAGGGLSNAVLRYLVINESLSKKKGIYDYIVTNSIWRNIIIGSALIIIAFCGRFPNNYEDVKNYIPILALLLPFQDLFNDVLYSVRAFFRHKLYAYIAFASSFVLIIGRVIGAFYWGVTGVIGSRLIINCGFAVASFYFVNRLFFSSVKGEKTEREEKKNINIYSLQYMITNGFWAIFMANDTFLIGQILNNPSELANYKVASVLPANISIFATAIGIFVAPYFTKNESDRTWIKSRFLRVLFINAFIVFAIAVLIWAFSDELVCFMFGDEYLTVVGVMRVLLIASFINSGLRYVVANVFAAMGVIKYNMMISGMGIVIQVILDSLMIPQLGIMGVAIANCVVYAIMAIVLFVLFVNKELS